MLTLLCIDSDSQRLEKLLQDLQYLTNPYRISSVIDLQQAQHFLSQSHGNVALILCSHTLLSEDSLSIFQDPQYSNTRKLIYADNPTSQQLIDSINLAQCDYFLCLPYEKEALQNCIDKELVKYQKSIDIQALHDQNLTDNIVGNVMILKQSASQSSLHFEDKFLDYSLYSDSELSSLVIKFLHKILEKNDEHHVRRRYSANHLLTHEGEKNNYLWFITKGEVLLKKRNIQGESQDITVMQPGMMVGGMSFLTGEPAFSTGITLVNSEVIKVDKAIFSQIMQSNTSLLAPFTNLLLRNFNRRLQHSISTELALQETLESLDVAHNQLVESEKMAVLGQLVAGVAHELNNPVSAILRSSDTLITHISSLLHYESETPFSALAQQTLQQGLSITPLSTSEIRQRTKALMEKVNDKKTAKQLVNMNLDDCDIPLENGRDFQTSVAILNQYHQVGTMLRNSNACATRISDLVKSLKHYAGQDSDNTVAADIHEGLEETLIIFENKLKSYEVIKEYQKLPKIDCHPIELEQVWTNIIANAIDAKSTTKGKGVLKISTRNQPHGETATIQVIIEDNGPGIPEKIRSKIFDLNYTTKREGNFGLGIGLTISSQIVYRHHGFIDIESQEEQYTRFIITLPVVNPTIENSHLQFDSK